MSESCSTTPCRVKCLVEILDDQEGVLEIGDMIVAALADGDALVEAVAAIEALAQLQQVALAGEADAELLADRAAAAVAAGEIARGDVGDAAGAANFRRDQIRVLGELQELGAVAHRHRRQRLRDRLEERLQRVLGNELVGLQRHRGPGRGRDLALRRRDRRVGQVQQRRLQDRGDDEDVHRALRRQAGGADAVGEPHAAVDFHGAGVAPLHLGQELRGLLLLDQGAAYAAQAEIDGEGQAHRTGADDQNVRIHHYNPWRL